MAAAGRKETHTAGRPLRPYRRQRPSAVSCTHLAPASLPRGIPGMGDEIDGAMQHAAHPALHSRVFPVIEEEARAGPRTVLPEPAGAER
jgi:hypothetical protein